MDCAEARRGAPAAASSRTPSASSAGDRETRTIRSVGPGRGVPRWGPGGRARRNRGGSAGGQVGGLRRCWAPIGFVGDIRGQGVCIVRGLRGGGPFMAARAFTWRLPDAGAGPMQGQQRVPAAPATSPPTDGLAPVLMRSRRILTRLVSRTSNLSHYTWGLASGATPRRRAVSRAALYTRCTAQLAAPARPALAPANRGKARHFFNPWPPRSRLRHTGLRRASSWQGGGAGAHAGAAAPAPLRGSAVGGSASWHSFKAPGGAADGCRSTHGPRFDHPAAHARALHFNPAAPRQQ